VCPPGPKTVFAIYSHVERFDQAEGAGHDLEENVPTFGLDVFPDDLMIIIVTPFTRPR
jgi:hypothetical protein